MDKFFEDDNIGNDYQSLDEWYTDIKHLIWPMIITLFLIALIFVSL